MIWQRRIGKSREEFSQIVCAEHWRCNSVGRWWLFVNCLGRYTWVCGNKRQVGVAQWRVGSRSLPVSYRQFAKAKASLYSHTIPRTCTQLKAHTHALYYRRAFGKCRGQSRPSGTGWRSATTRKKNRPERLSARMWRGIIDEHEEPKRLYLLHSWNLHPWSSLQCKMPKVIAKCYTF